MIDLIAFDADDTLWHTERYYVAAQARFKDLLAGYHSHEWIEKKLYETEVENLKHFGFGIKAFILSMIETALQLTERRVSGAEIQEILDIGKEMLKLEIQLLDGAEEAVAALSASFPLIIITKGDLLDQETKIARSGLAGYFQGVEVVSDKNSEAYRSILARREVDPQRFLMVGDSLRSDILPVLELGGRAVHIPSTVAWEHERFGELERGRPGYYELERIELLPALVSTLNALQ